MGRTHDSKIVVGGDASGGVGALKQAAQAAGQLQSSSERASKAVGGLGTALQSMAGLAGVAGAAGVVAAFDKAASSAALFQNLTANLPFSIEKATNATRGLVRETDLMRLAVQANRFGVAKSSEDFAKLAGIATKLGVSIGKDATSAVDDFILGLARGSPKILDNLGIMVDESQAHEKYAKALNKTTSELTEAEKKQAIMNEALRQGVEATKNVTLATDGAAMGWQRLKVQLGDVATLAANGLATGIDRAGEAVFNLREELVTTSERARHSFTTMSEAAMGFANSLQFVLNVGAPMKILLDQIAVAQALTTGKGGSVESAFAAMHAAGIHGTTVTAKNAQRMIDKQLVGGSSKAKDNRAFKDLASMDVAGLMMGRNFSRDAGAQDPFAKEAMEAELEATRQFEERKAEIQLNTRMRAIETQSAAGADPLSMINAEEQAQLEHLDFMERAAESELDRMAVTDQRKQVMHQAQLARVAEEQKAEQKRIDLASDVAHFYAQGAFRIGLSMQQAARAARAAGESESKARRRAAGEGLIALAQTLGGQAIFHGVEAAVAAATFNPVKAASELTAAGIAAAGAVTLSGIGHGLMSGTGGGGGGGGGSGGGGRSFGGGGGGGSGGGGAGPAPEPGKIPPSPMPNAPGQPSPAEAPGMHRLPPRSGGGVDQRTIHFHVLGGIDRESAERIIQGVNEAQRTGRVRIEQAS